MHGKSVFICISQAVPWRKPTVQSLATCFCAAFLPPVYTTRCLPKKKKSQEAKWPWVPSCEAVGRTCCWAPASWWVLTGGRRHLRSDWAPILPLILQRYSQQKSSKRTEICLQLPLSDPCPKPYRLHKPHSIPASSTPPRGPVAVGSSSASTRVIFATSNCHEPIPTCFDVKRPLAGICPGDLRCCKEGRSLPYLRQ